MPFDFDALDCSRPPWERGLYYTIDGIRFNPITNKFTFDNERTEKKMEVRDKICDKCGKRYSVAEMRVLNKDGEYTDKECYLDTKVPLENYPKMYHSRTDKMYVGRGMDLCPECAKALKAFAGED